VGFGFDPPGPTLLGWWATSAPGRCAAPCAYWLRRSGRWLLSEPVRGATQRVLLPSVWWRPSSAFAGASIRLRPLGCTLRGTVPGCLLWSFCRQEGVDCALHVSHDLDRWRRSCNQVLCPEPTAVLQWAQTWPSAPPSRLSELYGPNMVPYRHHHERRGSFMIEVAKPGYVFFGASPFMAAGPDRGSASSDSEAY